ncbi:hypothetical protein D3C78_1353850 [compost metagenome]
MRQLLGRAHAQNARRIDQHVQAFQICQHAPTNVVHLRRVRHVQRFGGKRIIVRREGEIKASHLRTRLDKRQRRGVADALTRARHPDGFAGKIESGHYFTSRDSSAHQASRVGFFASITKSISP